VSAVHLVLDTSAVLAYARGSEHVGETLTQVVENGVSFSVPLCVLATAAARVGPTPVDLLTTHPAFGPSDSAWTRWPALGAALGLVGRLDAAEALLVALDVHCDVLTAEPDVYAALGEDAPIITI
jgi:hypothetical protein